MFPGFEQFDQIFSDKQKQAEPKTPQYSPENPLYTYGSGTTVVNGQQLYTVGPPLTKNNTTFTRIKDNPYEP